MKRKLIVVALVLLFGSIGLIMNSLNPREAVGQIDPTTFSETGLGIAGVYVEELPAEGAEPYVVVIYADGNWTVRDPVAPPSFGVWEPVDGASPEALMLDASLAPSLDGTGATAFYTLSFDETLGSVSVTNTATMEGFTATRISATETGTDTDTDTTTITDTDTATETETTTDTGTTTETETTTETGTDTGTSTGL